MDAGYLWGSHPLLNSYNRRVGKSPKTHSDAFMNVPTTDPGARNAGVFFGTKGARSANLANHLNSRFERSGSFPRRKLPLNPGVGTVALCSRAGGCLPNKGPRLIL